MKKIKLIEQESPISSGTTQQVSTDETFLRNAYKSGCIPKWLNKPQIGDYNNKKVIYGTSDNNTYVFYADLTVENITTKSKRKWTCDSLTVSVSPAVGTEVKLDTTTCNQILTTYIQATFQYQYQGIQPRKDIPQLQKQINTCYGGGQYNNFSGYSDNKIPGTQQDLLMLPTGKNPFIGGLWTRVLRTVQRPFDFVKNLLGGKMTEYIEAPNPYIFTIGGYQNESTDKKLKSLIKENLKKLSDDKKNNIISERNIIKNRTNILIENRVVKTKKSQEKLFNDILSEAIYFNSQGFDKDLINEGFWDTITGFFGNHGVDSVAATFKEYLGGKIVGWFGGDPNSWVGTTIVTTLGNVPLSDYPKLTDCDYLTKLLSKSIVETAISKVQHDNGMASGIFDVIRNGLVDALDETTFAQKIESHLVKTICPNLNNVKQKLEDKSNTMKQKALSPS
jgi:hypothetical protein